MSMNLAFSLTTSLSGVVEKDPVCIWIRLDGGLPKAVEQCLQRSRSCDLLWPPGVYNMRSVFHRQ